jgi:CheY-specific phosphatase CheX
MRVKNTFGPDVVLEFLGAVCKTLRATVGIEAVAAQIGPIGSRPTPTVAIRMDLDGDVRGPVTWVFPPQVALELVRRLLDDPDPDPSAATDGATELANILTGRAAAALEANGFKCEFGPPYQSSEETPPGIAARLSTDAGPIDVVLSLT